MKRFKGMTSVNAFGSWYHTMSRNNYGMVPVLTGNEIDTFCSTLACATKAK